MEGKLISIVVPIYNEAENIPLLYKELRKHTKTVPYQFEFVLVECSVQRIGTYPLVL